METRKDKTAPKDFKSPVESTLDFDDATLRGKWPSYKIRSLSVLKDNYLFNSVNSGLDIES